ncbi:MAG: histidine phosphatase family protein [Gudongella sp.]|jgi:alpha-ribazole phosphatase|nr:histidine phosphatase family protein [Gudongella sp.]
MKITLIRHSQTEGNEKRQYIGSTDEPLSKNGIAHAKSIGMLEHIKHVYTSPMKRAIETAKICFPHAIMKRIEDLKEIDFGDFEGRTADEMQNNHLYRRWVYENCETACPNGEDPTMFKLRVKSAFLFVVEDALTNNLNEIAIVAHGGTIMTIMSAFAGKSDCIYDWHVPNCGGYKILIDADHWNENMLFSNITSFNL